MNQLCGVVGGWGGGCVKISADGWESTTIGRTLEGECEGHGRRGSSKVGEQVNS